MTGNIFDIRRFSTHDGSGIRTTVFFKGCPLCCVWCQNPEGIDLKLGPIWFESKCIGCKTCIHCCKDGGVYDQDNKIMFHRDRKEDWDELAYLCPTGAFAVDTKVWELDKLVEELQKDRVFFNLGGGVTLSGGEPLMQGAFVEELLKKLQECGIHTAIETSLCAGTDVVKAVVPHLDQIYADMKLADNEEHIRYTSVTNKLIQTNLHWILTSEYRDRLTVRTPLIPSMTATEHNLAAIARTLSSWYPDVKYELLNYNPLAEAKYHLVDREYCFEENPKMYTKDQMREFGRIVTENGIKNLILEI